jgi:GAF domain-containing protein
VTRAVDPEVARRSIDRLRAEDLLRGELVSSLRTVVEATGVVFAADGAGVMLVDEQQALHFVGATDGRSAAFEAAQEETGEGPCVDSLVHDMNVWTADLTTDPRWPLLTEQIGSLGIRAILGVPLHLGLTPIGSLNVYHFTPRDWEDEDVRAIEAHGRILEELLGTAMLARQSTSIVDQLERALRHRVVIERAVGVVMATEGLDPVRAFNRLRMEARSTRRRVADLAADILAEPRFTPDVQPPMSGNGPT